MNKSMAMFRYSFFTSLILFSFNSFAEDYFDPALLDGQLGASANEIDLSQFHLQMRYLKVKYLY
ncbi:hypothetical protein [Proteus terrae]|uniref:hypothetical protein n=1 Tax=Proteus terrae TaxID=1574161 RepID=UPI00301C8E74